MFDEAIISQIPYLVNSHRNKRYTLRVITNDKTKPIKNHKTREIFLEEDFEELPSFE
jgi:hypothetical protein